MRRMRWADSGVTAENTELTVAKGAPGADTTFIVVTDPDTGDTGSLTITDANAGLLVKDTDPDTGDTLTISEVGGDTASVGKAVDGSHGGSFTINADGAWEFDPDDDFNKLHEDEIRTTSVQYTVSDGNGGTDTATLTVTVRGEDDVPDLIGVNDDPAVETATGSVIEDTDVVDANGKPVTSTADVVPGNLVTTGKVKASGGDEGEDRFEPDTISDTGTHYGSLKIDADGDWTYTVDNKLPAIQDLSPTTTLTDTFTVTNADGVTTIPVKITIKGVNDAPVAVDDAGGTDEDTALTLAASDKGTTNAGLLQNDTDPEGDSLTITAVKGYTAAQDGTRQDVKAGAETLGSKGRRVHHPRRWLLHLRPGRRL